ncbi:MAG: FHA domain-containing protein [Singulisphaera sp.]|nr:FHA domain-containing protein [Singulisphaera sp.]
MYTCPQNHQSESPDFCSVCGIEISGAGAGVGAAAPSSGAPPPVAASGERCPDCGTPREGPGQIFCEICGHNFRTGASGVPTLDGPAAPASEPTAPREPDSSAPPPTAVAEEPTPMPPGQGLPVVRWDLIVEVDDSLYGTTNPDAPLDQPTQTFTLFADESLIGRSGTEVRVQIPIVNDHGVSRRHALLVRRPDGGLVVRDLGSTNGTQVNGVDILPGADVPVEDGDRIAIGAWTRIILRAVRPSPTLPRSGEAEESRPKDR